MGQANVDEEKQEQEPEEEDDDVDMPEAKVVEEEKHDEAMIDEVSDARGQVIDALGELYNVSENKHVCLYCGSIERDHDTCEHENKIVIKNAFQLIRSAMTATTTIEDGGGEAHDGATTDDVSQEGDDAATEVEAEEEEEVESPPEHMYDRPLFMSQVGDQDEYGSYCIDGHLLAQGGPTSEDDILHIVKEALLRGCYFFACNYYDGVIFAPKYIPWLDDYEHALSFDINTVLRHQVGRKADYNGTVWLKCDDGGWVMMEDFLAYEHVWGIPHLRRNHIPFRTWDRHQERWEINYDEGRYRMQILMKVMHFCVVKGKRVRIQMLGLGVSDGTNRSSPYCVRKSIGPNIHIPPEGLIIEPIAIRAPSAHTKNGHNEVKR
eukprot:s3816_g6.t1